MIYSKGFMRTDIPRIHNFYRILIKVFIIILYTVYVKM